MTFRVFGSFYAACTLVLWLGVAIRSLLELKNLANVSRNSLFPDKATPHHDGHRGGEEGGFNTIQVSPTISTRTVQVIRNRVIGSQLI